ncbi:MAG: hypothetical protein HYT67_01175 [Candidatus Yanofskybacteria bacterium]|nr:hypothetical protein [Candidatus Yanofskybacteria bacterium]
MKTISIPKTMAKEELLLLTRKEYDQLLDTIRKIEKKAELDPDLQEAIKEIKKGKLIGPFTSIKELRLSLAK